MPIGTPSNLTAHQFRELADLIDRHIVGDGIHPTAISALEFARSAAADVSLCRINEPMLAIVVQGKKAALLGEEVHRYDAGQYLVISVDLPLNGFVTEATPDRPYLGFRLSLDPHQLGDMLSKSAPDRKEASVRGLFVNNVDAPLLDCVLRLTRLLDTPQDLPILAPIVMREIHYRLLTGEQGEAVRQIATPGSNMQRIAQVLQYMKTDFAKPLRIEDLADRAKMSPSSFHAHFKAVTAMSPLQYQKQLRLLEARQLMLTESMNAVTAADRVGYESPSQFSREYARMFGAAPIGDIQRLRTAQLD
ncbi:MAG: AraC family transcriptional regulator [Waterburya sp.]